MSADFKLALAQMRVDGGDKAGNLARAEAMIAQAAAAGARCVVLPEAMDLGWTHPACLTEAESIPDGQPCRRLAAAARAHGVYVCAGLVEKDGDAVFNSAVILDPGGAVVLRHRKINELEIGRPYYARGDRLNVCRTALGTLGLMICADAFEHGRVLSRALCCMGAEAILSPCAWAVDADHDNRADPYGQTWLHAYVPVARRASAWIAGVSNVGWITAGPWKGKKCIGCSLLIGPDGREILRGPYGVDAEALLYADIRRPPAAGKAG